VTVLFYRVVKLVWVRKLVESWKHLVGKIRFLHQSIDWLVRLSPERPIEGQAGR